MVEPMLIDLKALLVEREDCDAGTVQKLREALAQGSNQYRALRDVTEALNKKLEGATGAAAKKWHLKLGVAQFFLGHTGDAADNPIVGNVLIGMQIDHTGKLPEHEAAQNNANGGDGDAPPRRRRDQQAIPADRRDNHQGRHDE